MRTARSLPRRLALATTIAFVAALLAPLADGLFDLQPEPRHWERRPPTQWAPMPGDWGRWRPWTRRLERWFSDRLGFRRWLTAADNQVRARGLGASHNEIAVCGDDGWLFSRLPPSMHDYLGDAPLSEAEVAQWVRTLEARQEWLQARGIAYYLVFVPAKGSVYPEHLPAWIRAAAQPGPRPIAQLSDALRDRTSIPTLDLRPVLCRKDSPDALYHRLDTHWNALGAYAGYRTIAAWLAPSWPALAPAPPESFDRITWSYPNGDLARQFALIGWWAEDTTSLRPRRVTRAAVRPLGDLPVSPQSNAFTIDDPALPAVVILGDSMLVGLEPYLKQHFRRSLFARRFVTRGRHANAFPDLRVFARERPELFIEQFSERILRRTPFNPRPVRRQRAARRFHAEGEPSLVVAGAGGATALTPIRHIELAAGEAHTRLTATGNDPSLATESFFVPAGRTIVVRADIEAPAPTTLQLFWGTQAVPSYHPDRSAQAALHRGRNVLYLRVPVNGTRLRLRLDPGTAEGVYRLHRLEARSVPARGE